MDSKRKLIKILRTLLTTGLAYVVSYGITLVLTPYITNTVGAEAYGFVSLARQFAEYAAIITMALNMYAARYISLAYHNNEIKQANVYFSSVFWGNLVLGTALMAVAIVLILCLEHLLQIPAALVADVKLLFLFVFVGFWVTTFFSVFGCARFIKDKLDIGGIFKTLSYVVNMLVLIVAYVLFPAKVFYVGLGTIAANLVVALADYWMSKKYTPELRTRRKDFSGAAVKRLLLDGSWSSLNSLGGILNSGLDLIVCNQMLSTLAMGQLAIAKTMHTIVQGLYTIVDQAFIPSFLKSYAANDKPKLLEELKLSMKVSGALANIAFAGFVALGMAYYRLWIPGQDIELIYILTVITLLVCIPSGAVHPLYYIYTLTVKRMIPSFVTIAGGVFNVIGMYVLIRYAGMGVYAVAWTTVVVMAVVNFITNPLYMAYVLKVPYRTFYPDILRNVLSCAALVLVFGGLSRLYTPSSWLTLVLCGLVYVVIGVPIHFALACNRKQFRGLLSLFKNIETEP